MKKVTKTLTGGLATVMASGMVPMTAMAATNFDELHKAAYDAVKVAQKTKTQADINAARKVVSDYKAAIQAEGKDGLLLNINTFSELLDGVQQPILTDIVNKILAMQEAGKATQAEINAIRELVDILPESLQNEMKTWNSNVDKFQKVVMEAAIDAVKTAETEKTQESIDAAKVLVDELATSIREAMKKVAADLQKRLDAIEVNTNASNVLKINNFYVEHDGVVAEFDVLPETLKDVTIEVVDNNGQVVKVQTVAKILEGKSKQKFLFKKVYASNDDKIEGKWTVNNVTVDMTEARLVKTVLTKEDVEDALVKLQEDGYINRLQGSYQGSTSNNTGKFKFDKLTLKDGTTGKADKLYKNKALKVNDETPIKTAKQLQEVIDNVNKEAGIVATEKERVDIIKKSSSNPVQFFNTLNSEGILRVNEEWTAISRYEKERLESYKNEIKKAETLKDVQDLVDQINVNNVQNMIYILKLNPSFKGWLNIDKVTDILDVAKEYLNPEYKVNDKVYLETVKAELEEQTALINVLISDNTVALNNSLKKLSDISKDFDYDKVVYEQHLKDYLNKIGLEKNPKYNTVSQINTAIIEMNKKKIDIAIDNIMIAYEIKDEDEITKAFNNLAEYTEKEVNTSTNINKFDSSIIVSANIKNYGSYINEELLKENSVNSIIIAIKKANTELTQDEIHKVLSNIKTATNEKELYSALSNELLELEGLVEANAKDYFAELDDSIKNAASPANYKVELENIIAQVNAKVKLASASTASEMETAIRDLEKLRGESLIHRDREIKDVVEELINIKSEVYGDSIIFNLDSIDNTLDTIKKANYKVEYHLSLLNTAFKHDNFKLTVKDVNGSDVNFEVSGDYNNGTADATQEITITSNDGSFEWKGLTIKTNLAKDAKITVSAKFTWDNINKENITKVVKALNPSATNAQVIQMVEKLEANTIKNKTTYNNYTAIRNACK